MASPPSSPPPYREIAITPWPLQARTEPQGALKPLQARIEPQGAPSTYEVCTTHQARLRLDEQAAQPLAAIERVVEDFLRLWADFETEHSAPTDKSNPAVNPAQQATAAHEVQSGIQRTADNRAFSTENSITDIRAQSQARREAEGLQPIAPEDVMPRFIRVVPQRGTRIMPSAQQQTHVDSIESHPSYEKNCAKTQAQRTGQNAMNQAPRVGRAHESVAHYQTHKPIETVQSAKPMALQTTIETRLDRIARLYRRRCVTSLKKVSTRPSQRVPPAHQRTSANCTGGPPEPLTDHAWSSIGDNPRLFDRGNMEWNSSEPDSGRESVPHHDLYQASNEGLNEYQDKPNSRDDFTRTIDSENLEGSSPDSNSSYDPQASSDNELSDSASHTNHTRTGRKRKCGNDSIYSDSSDVSRTSSDFYLALPLSQRRRRNAAEFGYDTSALGHDNYFGDDENGSGNESEANINRFHPNRSTNTASRRHMQVIKRRRSQRSDKVQQSIREPDTDNNGPGLNADERNTVGSDVVCIRAANNNTDRDGYDHPSSWINFRLKKTECEEDYAQTIWGRGVSRNDLGNANSTDESSRSESQLEQEL